MNSSKDQSEMGASEEPESCSEEYLDDYEVLHLLFNKIDKDGSQSLSPEEVEVALEEFKQHANNKELSEALITALKSLTEAGKAIAWEDFRCAVGDLPRVRGQRVQWVRQFRLDWEVAKLLKKGDIFDGLSGLRCLTDREAELHVQEVCSQFKERLEIILMDRLQQLRGSKPQTAKQFMNSKFSLDGKVGSFAKRVDFDEGPERLIGTPNPNVEEGMRREHCERPNSSTTYIAPNYNFEFTPAQEYEFVFNPRKDPTVYPHTPFDKRNWKEPEGLQWKGEHGREPRDLDKVMQELFSKIGKLERIIKKPEVGALRIYTGPMYILYNAILRKHPPELMQKLIGNRYETTIFCIISGISKLSQATSIPHDRRVYRGLGGMIVPDEFWRRQEGGSRGGVEWGLMSTTTNRNVALQYSGVDKRRGIVFEISVGRVDIGADLSAVSQYPGKGDPVPAPHLPRGGGRAPRGGRRRRLPAARQHEPQVPHP